MSTNALTNTSLEKWSYETVNRSSPHLSFITDLVKDRFRDERDQQYELQKIHNLDNRHCEVILHEGKPAALLVFKNFTRKDMIFTQVSLQADKPGLKDKLYERILELSKGTSEIQVNIPSERDSMKEFLSTKGFTLAQFPSSEPMLWKTIPHLPEKPAFEAAPSRKRLREEESSTALLPIPKKPAVAQPLQAPRLTCHELTLKPMYIHQIQSGKKTIEGRINSGICKTFRVGDHVRFFGAQHEVTCKIIAIRTYRSFADMLRAEGVQKCLADINSLESGIAVYNAIPNYTQRAAQSGVLAIELSKIAKG